MKYKLLVLIAFSLLISSCGEGQKSNTYNIELACEAEDLGSAITYDGDFNVIVNHSYKTGQSTVHTGHIDAPPCKIVNKEIFKDIYKIPEISELVEDIIPEKEKSPVVAKATNKYINIIKNGVLTFNKGITVGQALENWNECSDSKWEYFQTQNELKIVQFSCENYLPEFYDAIKSFLTSEEKSKAEHLNVSSTKNILQFKVNLDDTFEFVGGKSVTIWKDAKIYEDSSGSVKTLKRAYENTDDFDVNEIDKSSAFILNLALITARSLAK